MDGKRPTTRLQPPSRLPEPSWACPHSPLTFPGARHALLGLGTFVFVPCAWDILPPSLLNFPLTFETVSQSLLCAAPFEQTPTPRSCLPCTPFADSGVSERPTRPASQADPLRHSAWGSHQGQAPGPKPQRCWKWREQQVGPAGLWPLGSAPCAVLGGNSWGRRRNRGGKKGALMPAVASSPMSTGTLEAPSPAHQDASEPPDHQVTPGHFHSPEAHTRKSGRNLV